MWWLSLGLSRAVLLLVKVFELTVVESFTVHSDGDGLLQFRYDLVNGRWRDNEYMIDLW